MKQLLESIAVETGWFPPGANFQLRVLLSGFETGVTVTETGFLRLVYDDTQIGPGGRISVELSWRSETGAGAFQMDGDSELMVASKANYFGLLNFESPLEAVAQANLAYTCANHFDPFLLDGSTQTCKDSAGYEFLSIAPISGLPCGEYEVGGHVSEFATGTLTGETICLEYDGRSCVVTDSTKTFKSANISGSDCNTTLSINQSYSARYSVDLTYKFRPDACLRLPCLFIDSCLDEHWKTLTTLQGWPLNLSFTDQLASFTIDGLPPEITSTLPASGACIGDTVDLLGSHFGSFSADVKEIFLGSVAPGIISWDNEKIRIRVPDGAGNGISVRTVCGTSAVYPFTVGADEQCNTCCAIPGDSNGDDNVNLADASFVIDWLFAGGPDPVCCSEAGANGDDRLNIADVSYIIAWLFAAGPDPICGPAGMAC